MNSLSVSTGASPRRVGCCSTGCSSRPSTPTLTRSRSSSAADLHNCTQAEMQDVCSGHDRGGGRGRGLLAAAAPGGVGGDEPGAEGRGAGPGAGGPGDGGGLGGGEHLLAG